MRLDDLRPSDNVDDRRGRGGFGGRPLALGGGGLGLVGIVLVSLLLGVDPMTLLSGSDITAPTGQQTSQGPRADDASFDFARRIMGSTEDVWTEVLAQKNIRYTPATFTAYDYQTPTGCGGGEAAMGPFYCPADSHVYLDLSFFNELATRFGSPGQFAQAYVIAHEVGHHVQNLLGTSDQVQQAMQRGDRAGQGSASVRMELQADCYAGVWARHADQRFHILEQGDVESGLRAASAVGDDTLQKQSQGRVVPDAFTHGTSAQRVKWFQRGLANGDMDACNTFNVSDAAL
jgi:predicted metalloprotease